MKIVMIILLSLIGAVALIALCKCARWSFIYLIRYRLLRMEVKQPCYELTAKHDALSIVVALLTLTFVVLLLVYGLPIVLENMDFFTNPLDESSIGNSR